MKIYSINIATLSEPPKDADPLTVLLTEWAIELRDAPGDCNQLFLSAGANIACTLGSQGVNTYSVGVTVQTNGPNGPETHRVAYLFAEAKRQSFHLVATLLWDRKTPEHAVVTIYEYE
jgi:hypothetical protein